MAGVDWKYKEI